MPLRILVCPNAFKGSLTAAQAAASIERGLRAALPDASVVKLPLADGGDGTLETLVEAVSGTIQTALVRDPLGRPISARWGRLGGAQSTTGVIEMAEASGLRLLKPEERDPRLTSTGGTGDLMNAALRAGCTRLLIGIGGSATNDGGAGMAEALGAEFFDAEGNKLPPGGAALSRLSRIDLSRFSLSPSVSVTAACDVDNPLCGEAGASAVYGPQKGATPPMVQRLDAALSHYADILESTLQHSVRDTPGAGAAGGLGAGLLAFCRAELQSGIEMVMEASGFEKALAGCDLVVTGEGRLDGQTGRGKVVAGVIAGAKARNLPVFALAGSVARGTEAQLRPLGLTSAFTLLNEPMPVEDAMRDGSALLQEAAERLGWVFRSEKKAD